MRPEDILKEVLTDPNLDNYLRIPEKVAHEANMETVSKNDEIEVIKAVISGSYKGSTPQQTFNEIKRIKKI